MAVLPPLEAPYPLPPLPAVSPRRANYPIEARLDPDKHTIEGTLVLDWRNSSTVALQGFPFHVYWNAFQNNLSTSARGGGRRAARPRDERDYGWTLVRAFRRLGEAEEEVLGPPRYGSADRPDGRSAAGARRSRPAPRGAAARFRLDWPGRPAHGRTGHAGVAPR